MNNLKTSALGGMPYNLDDMRWVDAGVREAFKGIMSAFNVNLNECFILSGCVRSVVSGTASITEGYVSIAGEVCKVPAHSYAAATGSDKEYWTLVTSFDVTGQKVYQNSAIEDTYEIRQAKVVVGATLPAGSSLYDAKETIHLWIQRKYPVRAVVPILGLGFQSGCKIDNDGFAHFSGRAQLTGVSSSNPIIFSGAIPVGCRPLYGDSITRVRSKYTVLRDWIITIDYANGDLKFETDSATPITDRVSLDGIVPYTAIPF